jgi:acyl-coenzyme A thioesterase PaaI-like protein
MSSSKQGFYSRLRLGPRGFRHLMNLWPPFLALRIHIMRIDPDWRHVSIRMKLSLLNKNYVGTHFGGGLFAMSDPFYMLMLMNILGRDYLVWDKSTHIQFLRPGRGTVHAHFRLSDAQLNEVREQTAGGEKFEPTWRVDIIDESGEIVAAVDKTLYIRRKPKKTAGLG